MMMPLMVSVSSVVRQQRSYFRRRQILRESLTFAFNLSSFLLDKKNVFKKKPEPEKGSNGWFIMKKEGSWWSLHALKGISSAFHERVHHPSFLPSLSFDLKRFQILSQSYHEHAKVGSVDNPLFPSISCRQHPTWIIIHRRLDDSSRDCGRVCICNQGWGSRGNHRFSDNSTWGWCTWWC